jgi:hypothetical protein
MDPNPMIGETQMRHRRNPRHMTACAAGRLHFAADRCADAVAAQALPIIKRIVTAPGIVVRTMARDAVEGAIALLEAGAHLQSHGLESRGDGIVEIHSWRRIGPMALAAKHDQIVAG